MDSSLVSDDGTYVFVSSPLARLIRLRKSVYNAGMEISENLGKSWIPWMFTLTYRGVDDWKANHIKDYLQRVRVFYADVALIFIMSGSLNSKSAALFTIMPLFGCLGVFVFLIPTNRVGGPTDLQNKNPPAKALAT